LSSSNGPMYKKRKHQLEQRSTRQQRPNSKPRRRAPKSHSLLDHGSRVTAGSSTEVQLPSPPAPSAPHATNTDMSSDCHNLGRSSSDILPTLTEVTFRPHSPHCYSFTAIIQDGCDERGVSFSQVAQLIESISHVGKVDDFTIKPIEQHSFLLTGFSRHTSSRPSFSSTTLSTAAEAGRDHVDATRTRPQDGKAVDAGALPSEGSEPSIGDDDGDLRESNSESSSDNSGRSSEDEQSLSMGANGPWDPVDEQRLLAWKKEGRSWKWIFRRFRGRTQQAVRQRLSIVKRRGTYGRVKRCLRRGG